MVWKRGLMFMLLICLALASPCLAQQENPKVVAEVKALLQQYDKAFSAQDLKGVMETYASGPDIFLMGTGPGECYFGKEGIEGAHSQFFTRFDAGTLSVNYAWIHAGSKGDVAWFFAEAQAKGKVKNEEKKMEFNLSGTLEKHGGKWRFAAMHFSRLGVGPEPGQ